MRPTQRDVRGEEGKRGKGYIRGSVRFGCCVDPPAPAAVSAPPWSCELLYSPVPSSFSPSLSQSKRESEQLACLPTYSLTPWGTNSERFTFFFSCWVEVRVLCSCVTCWLRPWTSAALLSLSSLHSLSFVPASSCADARDLSKSSLITEHWCYDRSWRDWIAHLLLLCHVR